MSSEESTRHNPSGAIGTAVLFENNRVRDWSIDVARGVRKAWCHHRLP